MICPNCHHNFNSIKYNNKCYKCGYVWRSSKPTNINGPAWFIFGALVSTVCAPIGVTMMAYGAIKTYNGE